MCAFSSSCATVGPLGQLYRPTECGAKLAQIQEARVIQIKGFEERSQAAALEFVNRGSLSWAKQSVGVSVAQSQQMERRVGAVIRCCLLCCVCAVVSVAGNL